MSFGLQEVMIVREAQRLESYEDLVGPMGGGALGGGPLLENEHPIFKLENPGYSSSSSFGSCGGPAPNAAAPDGAATDLGASSRSGLQNSLNLKEPPQLSLVGNLLNHSLDASGSCAASAAGTNGTLGVTPSHVFASASGSASGSGSVSGNSGSVNDSAYGFSSLNDFLQKETFSTPSPDDNQQLQNASQQPQPQVKLEPHLPRQQQQQHQQQGLGLTSELAASPANAAVGAGGPQALGENFQVPVIKSEQQAPSASAPEQQFGAGRGSRSSSIERRASASSAPFPITAAAAAAASAQSAGAPASQQAAVASSSATPAAAQTLSRPPSAHSVHSARSTHSAGTLDDAHSHPLVTVLCASCSDAHCPLLLSSLCARSPKSLHTLVPAESNSAK